MKKTLKRTVSVLLCAVVMMSMFIASTSVSVSAITSPFYDSDGKALICVGQLVQVVIPRDYPNIEYSSWSIWSGADNISLGNHPSNEDYCNVLGEKVGEASLHGTVASFYGSLRDRSWKMFYFRVVPEYIPCVNSDKIEALKPNQEIPMSEAVPGYDSDSAKAAGVVISSSDTSVFGFTSDRTLYAVKNGTAELIVKTTRLNNNQTYKYPITIGSGSSNLSNPKITNAENVSGGTKITWGKVNGAAKYRVYVKNGSSWTKLGDTTSTSYTNKNVKAGTGYTYTVRCISSDGKKFTSGFDPAGKYYKYIAPPSIKSFSDSGSGVKITWGKSAGAVNYKVFFKNGSSWSTVGTTTGTSIVHKSASPGTTYTYTVRCLSADGKKFHSSFNSKGWSHKYIIHYATPQISEIKNQTDGIKLTWGKVSGVGKYRVFVKDGSSWKKLTDTTSNSYVDKSVRSGVKYTYTVRGINSAGTEYVTSFYSSGKSYTFMTTPNFQLKNSTYYVNISWPKVEGAKQYKLYYQMPYTKEWKTLDYTTGTSYNDRGIDWGDYTYAVKAIAADGSSSSFYSKTISRPFEEYEKYFP